MKKSLIIFSITGLLLSTVACNNTTQKDAQETAKPKSKYYCTMHPNVTADKPGTCSKCGMDLAERDTTAK